MNAGSVVGIPWGGGDIQTLPYAKELLELIALKGEGDGKNLGTRTWAHEPPGENFTT